MSMLIWNRTTERKIKMWIAYRDLEKILNWYEEAVEQNRWPRLETNPSGCNFPGCSGSFQKCFSLMVTGGTSHFSDPLHRNRNVSKGTADTNPLTYVCISGSTILCSQSFRQFGNPSPLSGLPGCLPPGLRAETRSRGLYFRDLCSSPFALDNSFF